MAQLSQPVYPGWRQNTTTRGEVADLWMVSGLLEGHASAVVLEFQSSKLKEDTNYKLQERGLRVRPAISDRLQVIGY